LLSCFETDEKELLVENDGESNEPTIAIAAAAPVKPAPLPAGYVLPSYTQYFSGALSDHLILLCHRKPNR
jgi:hypothetical protein